MKQTRLAVIIPCYNHAHYVGKAIESVLDQTRPPDLFLVIDDGSKDNSVEVIRSYEDRGVKLLVQENAGAHNTLNRAAKIAAEQCDLISILNSDDFYEPQRFEKCLPLFEGEGSEGTQVVVTGLTMIDPDNEPLATEESRAKWLRAVWSMAKDADLSIWEWMGIANFPVTSSNIIARADYLCANPFRPYRFNHDYFFLSGAAIRGGIRLLEECLLNYRVHPENNINSAPAPLLKEMLRMHLDLYHDYAGEVEADPAVRRRFYQYMAATQSSISSFHPGLFQLLLAKLAAKSDEATLESLINSLDESSIDELNDYPNKALVNTWDEKTPVFHGAALAEKFEVLKRERNGLKAELRATQELAKLRNELLKNKGRALTSLLGGGSKITSDAGKGAVEKLANLREALGSD
ncbi:MAG: glycosyltransferase family 2 protein [Verrucomicrobiales bacterium]|nr:glycosyltransferase family 2 protein [Verrucomicrobiales bacterium]